MSIGLRRLAAATAGALTVALAVGSISPVTAQDQVIDLSFLGEAGYEALAGSLAALPVGSTTGMIGSVGSADFPIVSASVEAVGTPSTVENPIELSRLIPSEIAQRLAPLPR